MHQQNSSQTNTNNLETRQRNADKPGKKEKSDNPQDACRLTKSSEEEEEEAESPGRQKQRSQGLFIESTSQVRSVRRKIRPPPFGQIFFLTRIQIMFILDAFFLLKLSAAQQNSPKCKHESDDTFQETSVHTSLLSSTLTFLTPPPGLPWRVSKSNKNLPQSTGISRSGNQKQSSTGLEDTQVCSQTGKNFENCQDNANVQPHLSLPETFGEDYLDCAERQQVTLTAGILKVLHDNEGVDNH